MGRSPSDAFPRETLLTCLRLGVMTLCLLGSSLGRCEGTEEKQRSFFESRIRPVLHEHCYSCHSTAAKSIRGGLLLDSREGIRRGGDTGPSVVPGNTAESLIVEAMRHETFEMPPKEKLPAAVIEDFQTWIEDGAFDPRTADVETATARVDPIASRDHWAFQPIDGSKSPTNDDAWIRNPIDAFVFSKLTEQGWRPAVSADKYTLLRRVTFDLIGLPPTEPEIAAFLSDDAPGDFERVVDRLLASPHYGQRWGRHWLDLVRYADTNGADENHTMPNAWRYRDWVIRNLNRDLPLDQFIVQQLAGDLLPPSDDEHLTAERLTATGMLVLGPKMLAEQDKEKMRIDIIDEQIDTVSKTFFGMTVACARCHDHKFDPISADDYYALAGIFASTRTMLNEEFVSKWMERDLPSTEIDRLRVQHQIKIDQAQAELDALIAAANDSLLADSKNGNLPEKPEQNYSEATKKDVAQKRKSLERLTKTMPAYVSVMAVSDSTPKDLAVHIRGNHLNQAKISTPRGAPRRLTDVVPISSISSIGDQQSGRLQLARWLTSPDHPLTARVMANRIWMWHFGQPLMRSPSNFGLQSSIPIHHELLDWLARRLIDDGWSLKRLHRLIVTSNTYRMASGAATYAQDDPDNQLLWRQNRRRLEVEPLCDSIRCAGDSLDRSFRGPPTNIRSPRRAVYVSINRAALLDLLSTFDYVETANHIEQRPVTTVPNQALFLMNNDLVHGQATALAKQILAMTADDTKRVRWLWMKLLGRPATDRETALSLRFLTEVRAASHSSDEPAENAWASLCRTLIAGSQFSYVD